MLVVIRVQKNNVISFKVSEKTMEMMDEEFDWCKRDKVPEYAKWQAKDGDTVVTLYNSGKVVFQGKDADIASDFWITTEKINSGKVDVKSSGDKKKSEKINTIKPDIYYSSSIGSDEVGTGDFFGPIVVTASFVSKCDIEFLEKLGVKDSKKLTDEQILDIVPKFIKKIPYESYVLSNESYNEYNKKYKEDINMNKIKSLLHNKVLYKLSNKIMNYDHIIVDEFAKPYLYYNYLKDVPNVVRNIEFFTKGEDKHLSVACASLISRYIFINEFDKLSKDVGFTIPKGAGNNVDEIGKQIINKFGFDKLKQIAKLNFKNIEKITRN